MKKKILATFLSAVTLVSCSSALAANYSDVNQSAWYSSYVNKISELNAFSGYEDGTFRPDNQITQEEFIKTVVCLICGELNESNAPTVKNTWNSKWSSWAVPYLDKAFELGLITEQDTKFKLVGIPCTRGEMAKVITRAVEYLKEEPVADTSTYIAKLNDYDRMKEEYKPYVLQAYAKGILSGYDDGTFRDDGLLTRAEASSVLVRLIDKSERINADETLYDYFGRTPSDYCLSRSKAMMFEDLVLQSIRYDGDTITLTVPDVLPESQRWAISIAYWDTDKDYDFTTMKSHYVGEPGTFEFNDIKVLEEISIKVLPLNSSSFTSGIFIDNGVNLSLERREKPIVDFNNAQTTFEWVQGQGYKDYFKDYVFDENKYEFELSW